MKKDIKNPLSLIALFLLPSVIIFGIYSLLVTPIMSLGYPNIVAFGIAALIFLPVFFVIILFKSKRDLGYFSIKDMISYNKPLKVKHYFWMVFTIVAWAGGVFTLLSGFDIFIKTSFFSWFPQNLVFSADYSMHTKPQLLVILLISFLIFGIIGPIVEEIYFRGFLLPRMEWMGWGAPIVNAFLFSLYHFWSPWQMITRFIAVIPLCIFAYKTKNIKVVIIAHCLLNIIGDSIAIFFLLLK